MGIEPTEKLEEAIEKKHELVRKKEKVLNDEEQEKKYDKKIAKLTDAIDSKIQRLIEKDKNNGDSNDSN